MSTLACQHEDTGESRRLCGHLLANKEADFHQRFTGNGLEFELLCSECKDNSAAIFQANLLKVCLSCFQEIAQQGCWDGIIGQPQVFERSSDLHFTHETIQLQSPLPSEILDLRPVDSLSSSEWVVLTKDGSLFHVDLTHRSAVLKAQVPDFLVNLWKDSCTAESPRRTDWQGGERNKLALHISKDGQMAAVVNTKGQQGVVVALQSGTATMRLERDNYHADVSEFPIAFLELQGRVLLIHGTAWNRVDVSEPKTGTLLTSRAPTSYRKGENRPAHYLDYFHSSLEVSPKQGFVADNGWVWAPVGIVCTWSTERWLRENVWESEDGLSKKYLCQRSYYWTGPLCWIDEGHLAVWGYGGDDEWLIPAVCVYEVESGKRIRWFAGPKGTLIFDDYLFSFSHAEGISVWDVNTGERLLKEAAFCPMRYHRGAKLFVTIPEDGTWRVSRLVGGKG